MATKTGTISFSSKEKNIVFSQEEECLTNFSSKNDIICSNNQTVLFQIIFEKLLSLNNRPFRFSIIDNHFDFGCHNNEI